MGIFGDLLLIVALLSLPLPLLLSMMIRNNFEDNKFHIIMLRHQSVSVRQLL